MSKIVINETYKDKLGFEWEIILYQSWNDKFKYLGYCANLDNGDGICNGTRLFSEEGEADIGENLI